jgi:hypothetical protein
MNSCTQRLLQRLRQRATGSLVAFCATVIVATSPVQAIGTATGTVLYDAVDAGAVLPTATPWFWSYLQLNGAASQGMNNATGVTSLSTSTDAQAGYGKTITDGLNSNTGFSIDFSLRLVSESHVSGNRSGLSLIVLDSTKQGVELSFWTDEVWTKNADVAFSHNATESVATNTTAMERTYRLTLLNGSYTLSIDGIQAFGGSLRNYGAVATGLLATLVYNSPSFVFFGDNTSSAAANFELSNITLAPVPEPGTWLMMLAGLGVLLTATRSRTCSAIEPRC